MPLANHSNLPLERTPGFTSTTHHNRYLSDYSLMPQRLNRIQLRCPAGWEIAKDNAHRD